MKALIEFAPQREPVAIVEVRELKRVFKSKKGESVALERVDLDVKEGEIFGLLGPNGAGKTTLIRILTTLLLPTSGKAAVCGFDIAKEAQKVRPLIGVASGSERPGYDFITARGNLWFFSQLYGISTKEANERIRDLSTQLQFNEHLDKKLYMLSTGFRQRVTIARGFVNDPKIVFMDEPTSGLDVITARTIRQFLQDQAKERGRTIFIATHNMVEGETICDRVAIIDKGRVLACDTPAALKKQVGRQVVVMEVGPPQPFNFLNELRGVSGVSSTIDNEKELATVRILVDDDAVESQVHRELEGKGMKIYASWRQEPTLEEVFIKFVGRGFAESEVVAS
jgi:ABC-2 type transport system ATP-binding protein